MRQLFKIGICNAALLGPFCSLGGWVWGLKREREKTEFPGPCVGGEVRIPPNHPDFFRYMESDSYLATSGQKEMILDGRVVRQVVSGSMFSGTFG